MTYVCKTKLGYDFFEVSSAFQKSIRRADEKEAMFWAIELYESGYVKYAWKRLIIIASEDIGLGEAQFMPLLMSLKQSFDFLVTLGEKHKPEKLPFVHAVLASVHTRKSRYVDLAISVYWKEHEDATVITHPIPDYAFDFHTKKGKKLGRGIDHFYDQGMLINNQNKMKNEVEFEILARKIDKNCYNKGIKKEKEDQEPEGPDMTQGHLFH